MLQNGLHDATRPAIALADESGGGFRRFGPGDDVHIVLDAAAVQHNLEGEVAILGEGVGGVSADRVQHTGRVLPSLW